ncbi:FliM/FliN family flagellar motor switch protein [Sulfitobacter sp. CW3]|jgi:flagellar motor switch protein FliN/FliY|uniref:FliM/FliN family flagellar motor switch protein n=1 Tax=unclassified Sulfitobacter TaxID=196795 RepID=UPI0019FF187D|nr:FliM/FliN family flagellar motor switch protein [Sulfitobacter sp. CW3]MBW4961643.1 FliM/FliN family flagellar motor switch protein [Sulfitobacter sp. CW3]NOR30309.1 flagellar motor switch protein FliN [Sulfitobacter sp.]|tara:strand:- start:37817 stop:38263 length:447 start_codon:yes stop_codon:yes gene_type:complete
MDKPDLENPKTNAETDAQSPASPALADALGQPVSPDANHDKTVFPNLDREDPTLDGVDAARLQQGGAGINAMLNVGLDVQVVLGQARMPISRLLELTRGSIVELNRKIGAPVDLMVSDRLVARGDLVKVGEDRLGVSLTQIVKDYVPD